MYDPRIILQQATGGFIPAENTLQDSQAIQAEAQRQKIAMQQARDKARADQQTYEEKQLPLDQQKTLQPGILSKLGLSNQSMLTPEQPAQSTQQAPVLPPQLGPQQDQPFMMNQGRPNLPPQLAAQQPQDPMAGQQSILDERGRLLKENQGMSEALAASPILASINKNKESNLSGRGDLAGDQYALAQNRAFSQIVPNLEAIKNQGIAAMRGAKTGKSIDAYNGLISGIQSAVANANPQLLHSKDYQDYMKDLEKFKPTPQPSMGVISMMPPPSNVLDNAAKRIANRESTISEEINKGRFAGAQAMQIHDDLVQRVSALDPTFSEQDTEAGAAFSKNPATRRALQGMENAYKTIGRLKDVYSKLNNTEYPTVNSAINAGKIQVGDVNAARAMIAEVLGNDELTKAFAAGGGSTDKLRDMSEKLANYNLSPNQMKVQFDELEHGLERAYNAYQTQGGGYIRKLKTGTVAPLQEWKDGDKRTNSAGTPMIRVNGKWQPQ